MAFDAHFENSHIRWMIWKWSIGFFFVFRRWVYASVSPIFPCFVGKFFSKNVYMSVYTYVFELMHVCVCQVTNSNVIQYLRSTVISDTEIHYGLSCSFFLLLIHLSVIKSEKNNFYFINLQMRLDFFFL